MVRVEQIPGEKQIAYPPDPLDSFSRLRVAHPFPIFDAQFNYGIQPFLFEQDTVNGSVVHIPLSSAARLSTGGVAIGNKAALQTRKYFHYQPGKAHNTIWTCVLGDAKPGVRKIIGLFDGNDGLAFIQDESGLGILRRTSTSGTPVDNIIYQSAWNIDRLDGEGDSGVSLDVTKNNIFVIDMQWLGAGRVRYGFDFGGHITYCHQSEWANTDPLPFMRTANLPFRAEIENIGIADSETAFDFTCVAINSGGGSEPFPLIRSTSNAELRTVAQATEPLPVLSIKPAVAINGLTNRGQVMPVSCQIASKDAPIVYSVVLNGILTGDSFADVNTGNSVVQVDVAATAISGGIVVGSGYLGAGAGVQAMGTMMINLEHIFLSNNIVGDTTDVLSVVISRADGINSNCGASITWKEVR